MEMTGKTLYRVQQYPD